MLESQKFQGKINLAMSCSSILSRVVLLLLTSCALVLSQLAQGQNLTAAASASTLLHTVHVDPVNGVDNAVCGTEVAPCRSVQQGANRVAPGGLVKLAQGTYSASNASASAVLDITFGPGDTGKDFTIQGGFMPPDWVVSTPNPALTVLDGENQRRVVNLVSVPSVRITLRNLSITRGFANTPVAYTGEFIGGGVHCRNAHPFEILFVQLTLREVNVVNNTVAGYGNKATAGGGVGAYQRCWLVLEWVQFVANQALGGNATDGSRGAQALGGGLFATKDSGVEGNGVWLLNNRAVAGSGGQGFLGSDTQDRADALGGGAAFQYNWVQLRNVVAENNEAIAGQGTQYGGFGTGGGILFEFSIGQIARAVFRENLARGGNSLNRAGEGLGGGVLLTDGQLILRQARFTHNSAVGGDGSFAGHGGGGGIYVTQNSYPTELLGENLVIAHNAASAGQGNNRWGGGAGLYVQWARAYITHATFASNTVLSTMLAPAAIVQFGNAYLSLRHSIVAFHTTGNMAAVLAHEQGAVRAESNLIWGNALIAFGQWNGTVNTSGTFTGNPHFLSDSSLHIAHNSAAVDQAFGSVTLEDLDGQARPYGARSDLGADEFVPTPFQIYAPIARP